MPQTTLIAPQILALDQALADLVSRNRHRALSPGNAQLFLSKANNSRESGNEGTRKLLLRQLAEFFTWLPIGTAVVINCDDGSWIVGLDERAVIDKFVQLFGTDAQGRMFTVGRPTHAGGGLCSK